MKAIATIYQAPGAQVHALHLPINRQLTSTALPTCDALDEHLAKPLTSAERARVTKRQQALATTLGELQASARWEGEAVIVDPRVLMRRGAWSLDKASHLLLTWEGLERIYTVDLARLRLAGDRLRRLKPESARFTRRGLELRWRGGKGGLCLTFDHGADAHSRSLGPNEYRPRNAARVALRVPLQVVS